jgi:hypothetical protein
MPESHSMSTRTKGAGLKQGIVHPCDLFLHGLERLPDDHRAHLAGAQVTNFLDLQEIKKRIGLGGGYQFGSFPTRQLTRRDPQYAKQVRSTVSVHG